MLKNKGEVYNIIHMEADIKLMNLMGRGYTFECEYLGKEIYIYTVFHRGYKFSVFHSESPQDVLQLEKVCIQHYRDKQLKSILDDVKINYFNGTNNLEN